MKPKVTFTATGNSYDLKYPWFNKVCQQEQPIFQIVLQNTLQPRLITSVELPEPD